MGYWGPNPGCLLAGQVPYPLCSLSRPPPGVLLRPPCAETWRLEEERRLLGDPETLPDFGDTDRVHGPARGEGEQGSEGSHGCHLAVIAKTELGPEAARDMLGLPWNKAEERDELPRDQARGFFVVVFLLPPEGVGTPKHCSLKRSLQ